MKRKLLSLVVPVVLLGCSSYGYRYQPHPQVLGSPVFADYREQAQDVDILVDTDGLRLQDVAIARSDGTLVKPSHIDYPQFKPELIQGNQEEIYGPELADSPTVAHFAKDAIGPAPWNVKVKIQDIPPTTILVGGASHLN